MKSEILRSILIVLLGACGHSGADNSPERLSEYLSREFHTADPHQFGAIVYLSEKTCIGCTRSLSTIVQGHLNDECVWIVMGASGTVLDVSPFVGDRPNVAWDVEDEFHDLALMDRSGVLFLNQGTIDTVVRLDARGADRQLRYISDRLRTTCNNLQ